ncbi:ribonuclease H-like domain-containing protein, partial [Tanacetum coccineum]
STLRTGNPIQGDLLKLNLPDHRNLQCDMPVNAPFPTSDVREEGDDSKPRSYDVTFSNPLFDFNDDFTLCNDNLFFDEEFEDISSLDPHELTSVIDESTLLVTLPLPCTDILGDSIIDIDLLLGEHLDTLSTGDREIDFNPIRDIEELERLLADDLVLGPRVFDVPLDLSKATNPLQAKELLQIKEMADQDTPPPTITAMKIPIIKKGEYDIWSMRMRQYICHTDHNLWDIIVNGDLEDEATPSGEQSSPPVPKTAKQLAARRNQERIKSILLLAIPDEYLLKFHNVPDAKSLWAAIKSRFGGNEESKKMQKNVLKHQFENFVTASNETLDKAYDRFQKLISQLEIHGAYVSKEDINQKFLRSLPPSWSQIALIMRNKPDIDEVDIDDLYNNLRVYEDELKRSLGSNSASQNLAFLSSENTNSTNEVSTASGDFGVSTAGGINQVPSTPSAHDIAYSFLAQPTTSPQLENEDFQQMDGDDLEELDLRWQVAMLTVRIECYNCHRKGHFAKECRSGRSQGRRPYGDRSSAQTTESSSQALVAQDGLGGYDWSNDFEVDGNIFIKLIKFF